MILDGRHRPPSERDVRQGSPGAGAGHRDRGQLATEVGLGERYRVDPWGPGEFGEPGLEGLQVATVEHNEVVTFGVPSPRLVPVPVDPFDDRVAGLGEL